MVERKSWTMLLVSTVLVFGWGCVHVPPEAIKRDRLDYGQVIADSWKRQTLINIVRLKYGDAPTFLDVNSIIETHSVAGTVTGSAGVIENPGLANAGVGATRSWSNTPTVTYQPLSGQKFTSSLLRPIAPVAVFQMIEAGWSVPLIFRTSLRSINGLQNQAFGKPADAEFDQLVESMNRVQRSQAISMRVEETKGGEALVVVLRSDRLSPQVAEDAATARRLLGLREGTSEFSIAFGSVPRSDQEVAVLTRSMLEIMLEIAYDVEVPAADIESGRVMSNPLLAGVNRPAPLIAVHWSEDEPADAFVTVPYRGRWFWIDDKDWASKSKFTFLMILSSLAESGQASTAPVVTVNAGR